MPSQEIGCVKHFRYDLFCVEWDTKPLSVIQLGHCQLTLVDMHNGHKTVISRITIQSIER